MAKALSSIMRIMLAVCLVTGLMPSTALAATDSPAPPAASASDDAPSAESLAVASAAEDSPDSAPPQEEDAGLSAQSLPAVAESDLTPTIKSQPQGAVFTVGDQDAQVSITAQRPTANPGASGTLTYQWYKATTASLADAAPVPGEVFSELPIDTSQILTAYVFCEVTNSYQGVSSTVRSESVEVKVVSDIAAATPQIVAQPSKVEMEYGVEEMDEVAIVAKVSGEGAGTLTYQWYRAADADGSNPQLIDGATESFWAPEGPQAAGTQYIFCVVTNHYNGIVETAEVRSDVVPYTVNGDVQINGLDDLLELRDKVAAGWTYQDVTVSLQCDIDLSPVCAEGEASWTSIGTYSSRPFNGTFDGNYHRISNLYQLVSSGYPGFFGYIDGGTVKNLVLSGKIEGTATYGAVYAPMVYNAVFENVGNEVELEGTFLYAGCFIGNHTGTVQIRDCYNTADIKSLRSTYCYLGAFIGNSSGTAELTDCYNTGDFIFNAATTSNCSGLIGYGNRVTITNCYGSGGAYQPSNSTGAYLGKILGRSGYTPVISNAYRVIEDDDGATTNTHGIAISSDAAKEASFAASLGSAFIARSGGYPQLAWEEAVSGAPVFTVQPQSASYDAGIDPEAMTVQVTSSRAVLSFSYQWYGKTGNDAFAAIPGATAASYKPPRTDKGTASYYCTATARFTDGTTKSADSAVADITTFSGLAAAAPVIAKQPEGYGLQLGEAGKPLAVEATVSGAGAGTLNYQWFQASAADLSDAQPIEGATSAVYTPSLADGETGYYYFCEVTNDFEPGNASTVRSEAASVIKETGLFISTPEELRNLRENVAGGNTYEGCTIYITADLDLTQIEADWQPIGTSTAPFKGMLDGCYHTVTFSSTAGGLFGYMTRGGARNLYLEGSIKLTSEANPIGSLMNTAALEDDMEVSRVISSVDITGTMSGANTCYLGGLIGRITYNKTSQHLYMSECANKGDIVVTSAYYLGGITGGYCFNAYLYMTDCYNSGTVSANGTASTGYCSGLVGYVYTNTYVHTTNCFNAGKVAGKYATRLYNFSSSAWQYATTNCYALADDSIQKTSYVTEVTEDEMASGMAARLGAAFIDGSGFCPQLAWEGRTSSELSSAIADAYYAVGDKAAALTASLERPAEGYPGSDGTVSYQWRRVAADGPADTDEVVGEGASFTPPTDEADVYYYYCIATLSYEDSGKQSRDTYISPVGRIEVGERAPSALTLSLALNGGAEDTITVDPYGEVQIAASAAYSDQSLWQGDFGYTWYRGTQADGSDRQPLPDEGESSLMADTTALGTSYYWCEVRNGLSTATVEAGSIAVTVQNLTVSSVSDLEALAASVNGGHSYEGFLVQQACDIDLSSAYGEGKDSWTPIGSFVNNDSNNPFRGTYDGGGHRIDGLYMAEDFAADYRGLFGCVIGAEIRNLTVSGTIYCTSSGYCGGVVGHGGTSVTALITNFTNVVNECDLLAPSRTTFAGGILGRGLATFSHCANHGDIEGGITYCGGISASDYSATLIGCYNTGSLSSSYASCYVSGIAHDVKSAVACLNTGSVSSAKYSAGIGLFYSSISGGLVSATYSIDGDYNPYLSGATISCPVTTYLRFEDLSSPQVVQQLNSAAGEEAFASAAPNPAFISELETGYPVITGQAANSGKYVQGTRPPAAEVRAQVPAEGLGSDGTISYQWYVTDNPALDGGTPLAGATAQSLVTPTALLPVGRSYTYCVVTNTFQGGSVSLKAAPSVLDITSTTDAATPLLAQQPKAANYNISASAKAEPLSVGLAVTEGPGIGEFSYQWYRADNSLILNAVPVAGATARDFTPPITQVGSSYYYCMVTNTFEGDKQASAMSDAVEVMVYNAASTAPVVNTSCAEDVLYLVGGANEGTTIAIDAQLPQTKPGNNGILSVKWYHATSPEGAGAVEVPNGGSDPFTFDISADADACSPGSSLYYYGVVTNTFYDELNRQSVESSTKSAVLHADLVSNTPAAYANPVLQTTEPLEYTQSDTLPNLTVQNEGFYSEGFAQKVTEGIGTVTGQWYRSQDDAVDTPDDDTEVGSAFAFDAIGQTVNQAPDNVGYDGTQYYYCKVTNVLEGKKYAVSTSDTVAITLNPKYRLYTAEDFRAFMTSIGTRGDSGYLRYTGETAVLMNDIDLGGAENPWPCVSNSTYYFEGIFDGGGHTINGMYIEQSGDNSNYAYLGLFAKTGGATIRNLTVKGTMVPTIGGGSILFRSYSCAMGGVVGYAANTSFENVRSEVDITFSLTKGTDTTTPKTDHFGGVFGLASGGSAVNCSWEGTISAYCTLNRNSFAAGGIGGCINGYTLENCYAKGDVASNWSGGIVGAMVNANSIANCYYVGTATAQGGVVSNNMAPGAIASGMSNATTVTYTCDYRNNYYDSSRMGTDCGTMGDPANNKGVSESEMRSASFLRALNAGGDAYIAVEGNTPRHAWMAAEAALACPYFTSQAMVDQVVDPGQTPEPLSVIAELPAGSPGTISYQWYKAESPYAKDAQPIVGATGTQYYPSADPTPDARAYYWCVATNSFGDRTQSVSSDACYIWTRSEVPASIPVFSKQPQGMELAYLATPAYMEVEVDTDALEYSDDPEAITYQWYTTSGPDDKPASVEDLASEKWQDRLIANATTYRYRSTSITKGIPGDKYFLCVVTNTYQQTKQSIGVSDVSCIAVSDTYEVGDVAAYKAAGRGVASFEGVTMKLTADIDLGAWSYTYQLGTTSNPFKGIFDGQGHSVSTTGLQGYYPYFQVVEDALIKNVVFKGTGKTGDYTSANYYPSYFVAQSIGSEFVNVGCEVTYALGTNGYFQGGGAFVGTVKPSVSGARQNRFINCYHRGTISNRCSNSYNLSFAGFVGMTEEGSNAYFEGCYHDGDIDMGYGSNKAYTVQIRGFANSLSSDTVLKSCYTAGTFQGTYTTNPVEISTIGSVGADTQLLNCYSAITDAKSAGVDYSNGMADFETAMGQGYEDAVTALNQGGVGAYRAGSEGENPRLVWEDAADGGYAIDAIADQAYTGSPVTPAVTVKKDGQAVAAGSYRLAYADNIEVGTGNVYAILDDGSVASATFSIVGKDLSAAVYDPIPTQAYTSLEICPKPMLSIGGVPLVEGVDYRLVYTDNREVGTATVSVAGLGAYSRQSLAIPFIIEGTIDDVVDISTAAQLRQFSEDVKNGLKTVGRTFRLTQDIDLSEVCGADIDGQEVSWEPIGVYSTSTEGQSFQGTFDGCGHTIRNLYVSRAGDGGLFASVWNASIKNLAVSGTVRASNALGGITAWAYNSSFANIVNECDVTLVNGTVYSQALGGIVGYAYDRTTARNGTISFVNCANRGSVSASYESDGKYYSMRVGGIIGFFYNSYGGILTMDSCYNTGDISGGPVGGLIGAIYELNNVDAITNCYSTGTLSLRLNQTSHWGYLIGSSSAGTLNALQNCYYRAHEIVVLDPDCGREFTDAPINVPAQIGKTADEMKSAEFLNLLNIGASQRYISGGEGYPLLGFEGAVHGSDHNITVEGISDVVWTGDPVEFPDLAVRCGSEPLAEGTDNTVSYRDNTDCGTAALTLTFQGAYYGSMELPFDILQPSIDVAGDAVSVATVDDQVFRGQPVTPSPQVAYTTPEGTRMVLTEGTDYALSFADNTAPGTAKVTVTGRGLFTGTRDIPFEIYCVSLGQGEQAAADVGAAVEGSWFYTGSPVQPLPTITWNGETLRYGTDFTCTWENDTEVGTDAAVIATGIGIYTGSCRIPYEIQPASFSQAVTVDAIEAQPYTGSQIRPDVTVRVNGEAIDTAGLEISYGPNTDVATGGTVTIASGAGSPYGEGSVTQTFSIEPMDVAGRITITDAIGESAAYTGEPIYLSSMRALLGDTELEYGTDFEVDPDSYGDNIDAGEASFAIIACGNYTGSAQGTFPIARAEAGEVSLAAAEAVYDGTPQEPAITATFNGIDVTASFDYLYSSNVDAGTGLVQAVAKADTNFIEGSTADGSFGIAKGTGAKVRGVAPVAESVEGYSADGALFGVDPSMEWRPAGGQWAAVIGESVEGLSAGSYEVRYGEADNTLAGPATTVKVASAAPMITAMSATPATVNLGAVAYGATTSASVSILNEGNITQTGLKAVSSDPAVAASVSTASVGAGATFGLALSAARANTGSHRAVVTVTSDQNPNGVAVTVELTITPKAIASVAVSGVAAKTYTGKALTQAPTLKDGAYTLSAADYTVSYANNINAGTATMTITGRGNYTGTKAVAFAIAPLKATAAVTVAKASMTYTGKALKPAITVKVGGVAVPASSYTAAYSANTAPGQATVKVTLKGNYSGTGSAIFKITPKKITIKAPAAAAKALTAKWTKHAGVTGYEVQTATNSKFTKNKKTTTVKKAAASSVKVSKLKAKTKYYVRIRAYKTVGKTKIYGAWSATKNVKTK